MFTQLAALWKKTGPMAKVGGKWTGLTEGLVRENGVWRRFHPSTPNYSAIVKFDGPQGNIYWDKFYAFGRDVNNGTVVNGSATSQVTVGGYQVYGLAITVKPPNDVDGWRRFELSLQGDTRTFIIQDIWVGGVHGVLKQAPVLNNTVTIYFYDMDADIPGPGPHLVEF